MGKFKKHKFKVKSIILPLLGCFLATIFVLTFSSSTVAEASVANLIGREIIPTGLIFENTEVGGLSGITYNPEQQLYYAIADDPGTKNPARFYTLKINFDSPDEPVTVTAVTSLLTTNGQPFANNTLDPEGIAFTKNSVFVSSEGNINQKIAPFIKEFSLEGQELSSLPIPEKFFNPSSQQSQGLRQNLGLESVTLTPDQKYLFTANENALIQDGEEPTLEQGTPCRILRYNLETRQPEQEFLYITEPLAKPPLLPKEFKIQGLVDLLAIDENHLISLERSFALGSGFTIRLFLVSRQKATNIQDIESLKTNSLTINPVKKSFLLNLSTLNIPLDNIEGLTWGSELENGKRSLILISDNNFNAFETTQAIALSLNCRGEVFGQ